MNVRPVTSKRDLERFIELPYRLHRNDRAWVPPLRLSERERFSPKHPFYEHAEQALFLAESGGRVVGRVAAIDDLLHNETHGDNLAFFGFFEAVDEEVSRALLAAAEAWTRVRGRSALRGPTNPSMNDTFGLQIDAFGTKPFIMMPTNPQSYPGFVEAAGYAKVKDFYAWFFESQQGTSERLERLAERARKRYQLSVRPLNMKDLGRETVLLKELYNRTWEKNWGFVRYTDAEISYLVNELKPVADPDIILFIFVKGEVAGMTIGLPNINQVFSRMNGRLLPFGFVHLLNRRRLIDEARIWALGMTPEYRYKGLELVLMSELFRRGHKKYKRTELSWILEDNHPMNRGIAAAGASHYKTYRLYQKPL